jgi:hypothetical protein
MYDHILSWLSLIIGIIGSVGGVKYLFDLYNRRVKNSTFFKIFDIKKEDKIIIVLPTQPGFPDSPNIPTTHEDLMALVVIIAQFIKHGVEHEIKLHNALSQEEKSENLFLICGPVGNTITKELLYTVDLPYKFVKKGDEWKIIDKKGNISHGDVKYGEMDFAITAKLPNPWQHPKRSTNIYLAAGIEGLGTWGGAQYLVDETVSLYKDLLAESSRDSHVSFVAVIQSESNGPKMPAISRLHTKLFR